MKFVWHKTKKPLSLMLAVALLASSLLPYGLSRVLALPDGQQVVISQLYGGGGNSGAVYKNDFIELYNPTDSDISLDGWKVYYGSASKSGGFTQSTDLTGTIKAGSYYLIKEVGNATANGADLPVAPDAAGSLDLSGTKGKVSLRNAADSLIDLVGYGTITGGVDGVDFEAASGPGLGNSTAAIRGEAAVAGAPAGNRGLDTDNNSTDFTAGTPSPRNSSYVPEPSNKAAAVTADPQPNRWPAGTSISLSSSTVGSVVYANTGNGFIKYDAPLTLNGSVTIATYAAAPGFVNSNTSNLSYSLLEKTTVAEARAFQDEINVWTEGVITHKNGAKTYIQDGTAGLLLYGFPDFAQVGDRVEVQGTLDYFNNLQEIKVQNDLAAPKVTQAGVGAPAPKKVSAADLAPAKGESVESQLVYLENVTIKEKNGSNVTAEENGQSFIIYSSLPALQPGATFSKIIGVVEQYNTNYQFIPLNEGSLIKDTFSVIATPGSGVIVTGNSVALTSPTVGAAIHYTVDGTNPTVNSPVYSTPIVITKNITLKAIAVLGQEVSSVYSFSYEAVPSELKIFDIQGETHNSKFAGQQVKAIKGIVTQYAYTFATGAYKGFYMQDAIGDGNVNTSDAILVYSTDEAKKPAIGDLVSVDGSVTEYNEGSGDNLTTTQLVPTTFSVLSQKNDLPAPIVLGKNGRPLPSSIIDNDSFGKFDPQEDAIDFFESLEGMRVQLPKPTILSPYWTSGSGSSLLYNIATRVDNGAGDLISPAGGLVLKGEDNLNPQRLIISYGNPGQEVNTGDTFSADVNGVIGYNNGAFKVIPAAGSLPSIQEGSWKPETLTLKPDAAKLLIASYNIENFSAATSPDKINKLGISIAQNMSKPDIIGLVEMQDNNGEKDNGVVDADQGAAALIAAIKAAGGPEYLYTDIAPVNNQDGGAPGGNIRVGFLYNPARVSLAEAVSGTKGTATTAVAYDAAQDKLTMNPGRIDPTNSAFNSSRKPLAAQFVFQGEKVIVIANHFNSKSGDTKPFGILQPPTLASEQQRHEIAKVVNGFVKGILDANPNANIVALGDLNDFQFTDTAKLLKGNELNNLIDKLPANERYTYTYDGNSQVLDHILVSRNLTALSEVDVVHLNADFAPSKGRVSDHDPVVAQIDLKHEDGFPLTILHTNDTHANLDTTNSPNNILRRVTAIKQEKTWGTPLLLDAGDVFSGTLYFNKYDGLADLEFMNLVGYDAMTFGNHEFDKGSQVLDTFMNKAKFPFVSSNVNFSADELLSKRVTNEITNTAQAGRIYPAIIKNVQGESIGIFGLTTEDTANISSPGAVTFEDHVKKAKETVAALQAKGINKIIAVSHLGYDVDLNLAKQVEGIDIIVGGHTHTKLDEAVVDNSHAAPTLIVQTGEKGLFLGKLNVRFDENGDLLDWDETLISIDQKSDGKTYDIPEDAEAKTILDTKYKPGIVEMSSQVVGQSDIVLDGLRENVRTKETNLGNLIADGMLSAAQEAKSGAVIALQNGGGIRASIDAGPVTQGEVLTVLPFNNDLVTISVTGQELKDALENGVSKIPAADGRFPHVAGMRFYYDSTKAAGSRIQRIEVKEDGVYRPLDLAKTYVLATNAFTAQGGDFYDSFAKAYKDGRVNLLYLPDYEVFTRYLVKLGKVTAANSGVEGRIVDLKGNPLPSTSPSPTSNPTSPVSTPSPTATPTPTPTATPSAPVVVSLTPEVITTQGKQVAAVTVSEKQVKDALAGKKTTQLELNVANSPSADEVKVTVDRAALAALSAHTGLTTLVFTTPLGDYHLPLAQLAASGVSPDGRISLTFTVSSQSAAITQAKQAGKTVLAAADFQVTVTGEDGKVTELTRFNQYVERALKASGTSGSLAVVRAELKANGTLTLEPVPFRTENGLIRIYSRSNSTYLALQSSASFSDLTGHWSKSEVESLAARLIVQGKSSTSFDPNAALTRAEFSAMLVRAFGLTASGEAPRFSDVAASDWYSASVQATAEAGIVSGYENGTFRPNARISRAEMATMTHRAMALAVYSGKASSTSFQDGAAIPAWASDAVKELSALGLVKGDTEARFRPQATATRAEAAALVKRMLDLLSFDF
ncbi:5'-nucleotidase C-terminal domain-containing protein [Gorillibacterium sp. CAU 1737]|uniref:5'-nucleotidase C-terminal domain-containing protein n=1 Tax=Gorillibacterium sp. CAU 1737 TaxID=3140362 RepID=UPI00326021E7